MAEDELNTLTASVTDFTVIPTYTTVEAEVTRLGQRIRALNNQIVSDRDYLAQLENNLDEVQTARPTGLAELYAAADVQLPDVALAAYDDVQAFHDSVIANRRQYLDAEIRRITADLAANTTERDRLATQRSDGLRLLSSGGAAETPARTPTRRRQAPGPRRTAPPPLQQRRRARIRAGRTPPRTPAARRRSAP